MDVLGRGLLVAGLLATGCYSPSLRDCTVACAGPDDCAGSQVCGADKLCAAPELAGKCAMAQPGPDADVEIDAAPRDAAADAPVDAMPGPMVQLRVQVDGKGSVVVASVGTCSSEPPQKGDCTYNVPTGAQRSAQAVAATGEAFTRWTSLVCAGQAETCTFTPFLFTSITAKFDKARP